MIPERSLEDVFIATRTIAEPGTFAYTGVDPKTAEHLRRGADHIRRMTVQTSKCVLEIGGELTCAKTLLLHGQFGSWLATEFGWSERTAQRYMRASEIFGSKNDTVSALEPTTIYRLSAQSTPENVRTAIVARLEAGERPVLADIDAEVRHARQTAAKDKVEKAEALAAWRAGKPVPLSAAAAQTRRAAVFILERLGDERVTLAELLSNGVDAKELVAMLMEGESQPSPKKASPQPLRSVEL